MVQRSYIGGLDHEVKAEAKRSHFFNLINQIRSESKGNMSLIVKLENDSRNYERDIKL